MLWVENNEEKKDIFQNSVCSSKVVIWQQCMAMKECLSDNV